MTAGLSTRGGLDFSSPCHILDLVQAPWSLQRLPQKGLQALQELTPAQGMVLLADERTEQQSSPMESLPSCCPRSSGAPGSLCFPLRAPSPCSGPWACPGRAAGLGMLGLGLLWGLELRGCSFQARLPQWEVLYNTPGLPQLCPATNGWGWRREETRDTSGEE